MEAVRISILGDICPTNDYRPLWDNGTAFDTVRELLSESDLSIVNLECPATDCDKPITKCGPCLKAEIRDIALVKDAGFNLISIANNHIKDYGEKGVIDTIEACNANNVAYLGAGENSKKAKSARFFDIKNKRIGVISFAEEEFNLAYENEAGANFFDVYESPEYIAKCKNECDFLIVLYHGGIEHYSYPSEMLQKKCRMLVRFGADAVICQHSHCIGTYENYEGGYILYGQGNGVYGYRSGSHAWNEGLLITLSVSDKLLIEYTLLKATPDGIVKATDEEQNARISQLNSESDRLTDKEFLRSEWKRFCQKSGALNRPLFYGKGRVAIKLNRITKNRLFRFTTSRKKEMVTMNFARCDALREVMITLLENDVYDK